MTRSKDPVCDQNKSKTKSKHVEKKGENVYKEKKK